MKKHKLISIIILCLFITSFCMNAFAEITLESNTHQIPIGGLGGYNDTNTLGEKDGVEVSKIISETDTENFFDITLKVKTQSKVEEIIKAQDLAVVLVLDISNTMNKKYENSNTEIKLDAAKKSVNNFISEFYEYSKNVNAVREIGLVTFNRDAQSVFNDGTKELINIKNVSKDSLTTKVDNITAPGDTGKPQEEREKRWTNMEAGLKKANDILETTNVKNKYVIFLTDGLPTTYIETGYTGYTPGYATHDNTSYYKGNFYNFEIGQPIGTGYVNGTNYSEWGARQAELEAYNMKENGIKIFSIGIDIANQDSIYRLQYDDNSKYAYTVDTDYEANNYKYTQNNTYKKARYYTILPGVNVTSRGQTDKIRKQYYDNTDYYKIWLSEYIGSDTLDSNARKYYFDSENEQELKKAYQDIFKMIKELSSTESLATWVAEDPMGVNENVENIEFIGFYDYESNIQEKLSKGEIEPNTATFNDNKISWDLKNSTPQEETIENITYYTYTLKYRVRLENELATFKIDKIYNTNDTTTLTYVIRENGVLSENKTIEFPIPQVIGYLAEFEFTKKSSLDGSTLSGVEFKLVHDEDCTCKNGGKYVEINDITSTSDNNGIVSFKNIPSGHKYKLIETKTQDNYEINNTIYNVEVKYGVINNNIENNTIYNDIKTTNLTIKKIVKGNIKEDREFEFILKVYFNDKELTGVYKYKINDGEEKEININKDNIKLKNNEEIVIFGLPISSTYSIEEINTDGYYVEYKVNDSVVNKNTFNCNTESDCNLSTINNIVYTNHANYILPKTGKSTTLILIIIGSLLLIGPVIYISYLFYKEY